MNNDVISIDIHWRWLLRKGFVAVICAAAFAVNFAFFAPLVGIPFGTLLVMLWGGSQAIILVALYGLVVVAQ